MKNLAEIYDAHRDGLYALALSIVHNPDLAEDAIQDGVCKLCRLGREPTGDPVAYLFASVRNAAIDVRARQRPAARLDEVLFDRESPLREGIAPEMTAQLQRAVADLPPAQREAVIMKVISGLTFAQIAEVSGEPLPTVASRYRRALDTLQQSLETSHERP